jgi:SPOR domain
VPDPISSTDQRPRPPDPATAVDRSRRRRWWSVVFPVCGFALFAAVAWLAYQDVSRGPPAGEAPLIKAAAEPIKLPPDQAADASEEESEDTVGRLWSDAGAGDQPERLLPLPETPMSPAQVAPPEAPTAAPEELAPQVAAPVERTPTGEGAAAGTTPPAPPSGASTDAEAALDRLLAEVAALPDGSAGSGASSAPAPTAATTEARPASTLGRQPVAGPERAETPVAAATGGVPRAPAEGAAPRPPEPSGVATGAVAPAPQMAAIEDSFRVQVAAVREEADARRAWDQLVRDLGPVLSEVQPFFERAETANGVFYRVQLGRFATQQSAESLCDELKQRNASCFVIRR